MPVMREATPGAFRLPAGARDRERVQQIEARLTALEKGGASASSAPGSDVLGQILARLDALEAPKPRGRKPKP